MLERQVVLQKLVHVVPALDERLVDYWKEVGDHSTVTGDFCVLAQYIHDSTTYGWSPNLPEIFRLLETFLEDGSDDVQTACVACLEGLLERETRPDAWTPLLGPRTREVARAWDERLGRWTPGLYPEFEQQA